MEYEYKTETSMGNVVDTALIDENCMNGWEMMSIERPTPSVVVYHFRREN